MRIRFITYISLFQVMSLSLHPGDDSSQSISKPKKIENKCHFTFKSPIIRFFFPILLAMPIAYLILFSPNFPAYAATVGTFFFAFGTGEISAIIVGTALGLNPFLPALLVAFIESDMSLFIAWNFDYLKRIPKLGPLIEKYEKKAEDILSGRKALLGAEFALIFFMMFIPFHGTGAVTMTIAGRILALGENRTWLAVTLGTLTRSLLVASLIYLGLLTF